MKLRVITAIVLAAALACNQPGPKPQAQESGKAADSSEYIPVRDYILSQIASIDSLPVGILKRETIGSKTDSSFISPEEFRKLAQEFLPAELEKDAFKRMFSETSFMDQTTESLAFTYQAKDASSSVKRVDVLAAPSLELDKIKSIYMEKAFMRNDTAFTQKMLWKVGKSFSIISTSTAAEQGPGLKQLKVIWDPMEY
jgi:hypothetical protein